MIETLAVWSAPKETQTKFGAKLLRKAQPTEKFWTAWRSSKEQLKSAGVSCSRNNSGDWELCWWLPITAEMQAERKQAVEASRAAAADISLPHPDGYDYMPFQKAGIKYALDRKNVLFGDEMGLGKTIQAIGVLNADESIRSAIIVCPKSLKLNWKRELERWLARPLTIGIANGDWPETDIVVLNYEAVKKHAEKIMAREWGAAIVDEAHYIKNPKAQRSKAVKTIRASRKIRMTGTPIVNRPAELQSIIDDLEPAFAGFGFLKRYAGAHQNGYGWDFSGATNLDELQRRLRETIMVRRLKADVLAELPRKIRQIVELEADDSAMKSAVKSELRYEAQSEERLASLRAAVELSKAESDEAYQAAVARLTEASRVDFTEMSKLRHETALVKVPAVIAHLENALDDDTNKIIVAAHHHDVIDQLTAAATERGWKPVWITGDSKEQERQTAVDNFQNDPNVRIFIGSITAAGVGITLTASSHVVFAELDWVPGNVTQFEDRAHRIGQTQTVLVQHLVLSESLDARMARTIVAKQAVIDSALDVQHPERQAPVYEPKQTAASHSETVDKLAELAMTLTDEQISAAHTALRLLAGMDSDYARDKNDYGFNRIDGQIGHDLAERNNLTPKQAALGIKICKKYHRQLPADLMEKMNGK